MSIKKPYYLLVPEQTMRGIHSSGGSHGCRVFESVDRDEAAAMSAEQSIKRYGKTRERLISGAFHETCQRSTIKPLPSEPDDIFKDRVRRLAIISVLESHAVDCEIDFSLQNGEIVAAEIAIMLPPPALLELPKAESGEQPIDIETEVIAV